LAQRDWGASGLSHGKRMSATNVAMHLNCLPLDRLPEKPLSSPLPASPSPPGGQNATPTVKPRPTAVKSVPKAPKAQKKAELPKAPAFVGGVALAGGATSPGHFVQGATTIPQSLFTGGSALLTSSVLPVQPPSQQLLPLDQAHLLVPPTLVPPCLASALAVPPKASEAPTASGHQLRPALRPTATKPAGPLLGQPEFHKAALEAQHAKSQTTRHAPQPLPVKQPPMKQPPPEPRVATQREQLSEPAVSVAVPAAPFVSPAPLAVGGPLAESSPFSGEVVVLDEPSSDDDMDDIDLMTSLQSALGREPASGSPVSTAVGNDRALFSTVGAGEVRSSAPANTVAAKKAEKFHVVTEAERAELSRISDDVEIWPDATDSAAMSEARGFVDQMEAMWYMMATEPSANVEMGTMLAPAKVDGDCEEDEDYDPFSTEPTA